MDARLCAIAAALMIGLSIAAPARAQQVREEINPDAAARVKAAFVLSFMRHTQWPEERFDDRDEELAPIIVGILGYDPDRLDLYVERIVHGETVHGRQIRTVRLSHPVPAPDEETVDPETLAQFRRELRETHVLVVARSERPHLRSVLDLVRNADVLTVSDVPEFASRGGMLGLRIQGERIAIDANVTAIQETKLTVGSRLLRIAHIVTPRQWPRETP